MKKDVLVALVVLFAAAPSLAGTRSCTNALVTAGICRATSDVVYTLPISTVDPDGAGPLVAPSALVTAAFTTLYGYQSPTACTADMVSAGICTSGQIGQQVTWTQGQFVDFQIRIFLLQTVRQYRIQQGIAAAQATATAQADPDIGQ